jgi:hypothetical protein
LLVFYRFCFESFRKLRSKTFDKAFTEIVYHYFYYSIAPLCPLLRPGQCSASEDASSIAAPSVQNGYHSHLYFLVLPNCCSVSKSPQTKYHTLFLADVAKELILAGKVKLHGSMAQAKFSHSSLNPIFSFIP